MNHHQFMQTCSKAAIASGAFLLVDGALLDVIADESIFAKAAGVISLALGVIGITGIYLVESRRQPCKHLDAGYFLNVAGLVAVVGIGFSRNFVLTELDEPVRDALLDSGPTFPAIIVAAVIAVLGFLTFGSALIRHKFDALGSWGYTIFVSLSGFAAQLPSGVAAVLQGLGGLAIIRLGYVALRYTSERSFQSGLHLSEPTPPTTQHAGS